MDNSFYTNKQDTGKKSPMTAVVAVQLILSLLVAGTLFLVCIGESELAEDIKDFYKEESKMDIAVSVISDTFKGVIKETFSPTVTD